MPLSWHYFFKTNKRYAGQVEHHSAQRFRNGDSHLHKFGPPISRLPAPARPHRARRVPHSPGGGATITPSPSLSRKGRGTEVIQTMSYQITKAVGLVLMLGVAVAASAAPPVAPPPAVSGTQPSPDAIAFFEKSIRPVLIEKCVSCHGDKTQSASLRLDSRAMLMKGSDSGAVIDLASPEKSKLLQAILYAGAVKMPPSGKLPDRTIAEFKEWEKQGAVWTAGAALQSKSLKF